MALICPKCHEQVEFHRTRCAVCDNPVGYPNVRKAEEMRNALHGKYETAVTDAANRGASNQLSSLEAILSNSVATINVRPAILLNMTLGAAYRSYHVALDQRLRSIAEETFHAHRSAVDSKVHPGYGQNIVNAALSPDGRGLTNYGEITLRISNVAIDERSSLLRENAFSFFERNDLGARDAKEEPGWRAVWADRWRLGVAHLASIISSADADADLPSKVLFVGINRDHDRFLEIHVYGAIELLAVAEVNLDRPLVTDEAKLEWEAASIKARNRGIIVRDRVSP